MTTQFINFIIKFFFVINLNFFFYFPGKQTNEAFMMGILVTLLNLILYS